MKELLDALKLVLSTPGGSASALGESGLILVADTLPRIQQAKWILQMLDQPGATTAVLRIELKNATASGLSAAATAIVEARNAIEPRPLKGKLRPLADSNAVILVAPEDELPIWRDLIERFDQRQEVVTRGYTPRHFSVAEVARLVEQVARESGPGRSGVSGDRWQLIPDELTGTLIVTATPREHERVEELMARLDSVPAESRRPMRVFELRNRPVGEVLEVLSKLIEAGVLEGTAAGIGEQPDLTRAAEQRTVRSVLPTPSPASRSEDSPVDSTTTSAPPEASTTEEARPNATPSRAMSREAASERPPLSLTADEATNTLIAIGEARLLSQLEGLIGVLDVRQPQVMLEVLVVSLTDAETLDLGVEIQKIEVSGSTLITLSSLFGLSAPGMEVGGTVPPGGRGFTGSILSPGDFSVLIRALETLNDGRSLTMPRVLVSNNQQATLDSVLQQPFTATNASDTVATTSFGGTQDAGTTVTIKPQIAEGDHLLLEYAVSLSTFVGESADPSLPPPRQQNSLQSVVSIPDGYTVVVGGLDVVNEAKAVTQVPLLGSIPVIGEAFKNRSISDSRSRFYVFIRAGVLRRPGFEDLKYISDEAVAEMAIDDGWPEVEPRVIR